MSWLTVVGIGEDGVAGLSAEAMAALAEAAHVVGGARHLALAARAITGTATPWPSPLSDGIAPLLALRPAPVVVLASGDPWCFGIASLLARQVPPHETRVLPALSAFTLACAALGWARQEVATLSCCGRPVTALVPHLQPGARLLVLSADARTPAEVAALLVARGLGSATLHVLEALGGTRQRLRSRRADEALADDIDPLNLLGIEIPDLPAACLPLSTGLPDVLFAHDGQMTKREIRAATLSALAPRQGQILWDIGCGSGSIAIEWMLRHPANRAVGVEADPVRVERALANARALGAPGLRVLHGVAPSVLPEGAPDAVFIGGGVRGAGLIDASWAALKPGGTLVANVVTIEGEAALIEACLRLGGEMTRLSVSRLDKVGGLHGFRPAMTVTQWVARKSRDQTSLMSPG